MNKNPLKATLPSKTMIKSKKCQWRRMNICDDNDKIDYDIELTLTRSSFSTLSLTSNHPGPFKADKSFFTVVFWELPFSHSLIMDNITFLRARSDQPRSSRAFKLGNQIFLEIANIFLTSSDLSLATLTKSLFSFLANFWLSLWIMLLLQISSQTSSQFSETKFMMNGRKS